MKIRSLLLAICLGGLAALTQAEDDMATLKQKALTFRGDIKKSVAVNYLLFLPRDYDADKGKSWPLMLFLHGAGERGTNLVKVAVHGPPKLVKNQPDFPFILVSPQCPSGERWNDDALLALLDDVTKTYRVDKKRVYLTGLSMGGFGTWSLGIKNPDRFAALVPICGGGSVIDILLADPRKHDALKSLPIWAFHGAKDNVVALSESERMVEAIKRDGGNAKLTVYPEANHDSWTATYANPELYAWLLEQSRK
ncbi:MAG TPA: prolyl oligopeptidase family serine peptidase [Verrucomicrobiae bacterium]|nr:prolyl oligopeptidase family serine peptidase [Verrucomicrobiae bacterium]